MYKPLRTLFVFTSVRVPNGDSIKKCSIIDIVSSSQRRACPREPLLPRPLRSALPHSAVLRVIRISGRSSLPYGAVLSCPHLDSCCLESSLPSNSRLSWVAHDVPGIHARGSHHQKPRP